MECVELTPEALVEVESPPIEREGPPEAEKDDLSLIIMLEDIISEGVELAGPLLTKDKPFVEWCVGEAKLTSELKVVEATDLEAVGSLENSEEGAVELMCLEAV